MNNIESQRKKNKPTRSIAEWHEPEAGHREELCLSLLCVYCVYCECSIACVFVCVCVLCG